MQSLVKAQKQLCFMSEYPNCPTHLLNS